MWGGGRERERGRRARGRGRPCAPPTLFLRSFFFTAPFLSLQEIGFVGDITSVDPSLLSTLVEAGYPMGCVTNKAARFTTPVLRGLGLLDAFGIVLSGDTLPEMKPHPAPLLHAAAHFNVAPEDSLLVGDSITDIQAARAAEFGIVCMSYGYNHGRDIREAQPDAVLDRLTELPGLLEGLQQSRS